MPVRKSQHPDVLHEAVNACIYCGRKDVPLTDEHIFPLALGGTHILLKASCLECASTINREIEGPISSTDWGYAREKLKMPTRGKTTRTHVVCTSKSGSPLLIPIEDFPVFAVQYNFGTARLLTGSSEEQKRDILLLTTDQDGSGDAACKAKYPDWDGQYSTVAKPDAFARLLAKVAWGWVIAYSGSNWFRETITPLILGTSTDYTAHVGGSMDGYVWTGDPNKPPGHLILPKGDGTAWVVCEVAFTNNPEGPHYHVVLGETDMSVGTDQRTITFGTGEAGPPPPCVSIKRNMDPSREFWMQPRRPITSEIPTLIETPPSSSFILTGIDRNRGKHKKR